VNYYNFHIGDYAKHTSHLTLEEDLTYRRLLDFYYDTESPIPNDNPLVSRRLRVNPEVLQTILDEFFVLTDEGYRSLRADAEIAAYQEYLNKQRTNGKLGGRPKKTQRKPTANPSLTQVEPKITLTNNHKPITNNQIIQPPDGVSDSLWSDFKKLRTAKKAPITETALAGIQREANKAGIPMSDVLAMCCERGWSGFKADWVKTPDDANRKKRDAEIAERERQYAEEKTLFSKPSPEIQERIKSLLNGRVTTNTPTHQK